jgi:hypothetical protein
VADDDDDDDDDDKDDLPSTIVFINLIAIHMKVSLHPYNLQLK